LNCALNAKKSNADFVRDANNNIVTHSKKLDKDPQEVLDFLTTHLGPPRLKLCVHGMYK
jgi:hypothetical protein